MVKFKEFMQDGKVSVTLFLTVESFESYFESKPYLTGKPTRYDQGKDVLFVYSHKHKDNYSKPIQFHFTNWNGKKNIRYFANLNAFWEYYSRLNLDIDPYEKIAAGKHFFFVNLQSNNFA